MPRLAFGPRRAAHGHALGTRARGEDGRRVARAIGDAHRLGIVHRDLKPANILLAADGEPKVSDFGLARSLASDVALTHSGQLVGTPCYMAPEQAEPGAVDAGPAANVYSLGAIVYELLTGHPPFRAATTLQTLHLVRSREPVPPRELQPATPRDLQTICLKCLEKEPGKRYATAGELADDLRRFLDHEPIRASPRGPFGRLARWGRRNPVPAGCSASRSVGRAPAWRQPAVTTRFASGMSPPEKRSASCAGRSLCPCCRLQPRRHPAGLRIRQLLARSTHMASFAPEFRCISGSG